MVTAVVTWVRCGMCGGSGAAAPLTEPLADRWAAAEGHLRAEHPGAPVSALTVVAGHVLPGTLAAADQPTAAAELAALPHAF
ncbi:hypothetical protein SAMN05428942_7296 [Streptomyces sp. 2112.2]|uniref:hypothetical protein n=1 Tax=Streptomyces sp. 2112.2 TaxID=1881024 RepID=UPI00089AF15D|nr:hypothetical protein [Streptomyces sp. 2112.2]SEF16555.1 hypothetical protein SAMN05428942_7296 [Streptomyces sp. 2112.2]